MSVELPHWRGAVAAERLQIALASATRGLVVHVVPTRPMFVGSIEVFAKARVRRDFFGDPTDESALGWALATMAGERRLRWSTPPPGAGIEITTRMYEFFELPSGLPTRLTVTGIT